MLSAHITSSRPSQPARGGGLQREGDSGGCHEEEGDETQRQKPVSHWTSSPVPKPINHTDVGNAASTYTTCLCAWFCLCVQESEKCVWVFLSVETYGFIDELLSNSSCLPSGLLLSGHNIVGYFLKICTHIYLIKSIIQSHPHKHISQVHIAFIEN